MDSNALKDLEDAASKARDAARKADEAVKLARRQADLDSRRVLRPLAQRAHDAFCRWNHTDGCSWGYECDGYRGHQNRPTEDEVWSYDTHARWLDRVAEAVKRVPADKLIAILTAYEGMKREHPEAGTIVDSLRRS